MMASKLPRVVPTCHEGGFGSWFELEWAGRPNHSMTARHVVLAKQKLMTYVYAVELKTKDTLSLEFHSMRRSLDDDEAEASRFVLLPVVGGSGNGRGRGVDRIPVWKK
ncbi:hypothetical protein TIFTF001_035687 [Ficus carica]|uniref:Uncharacterized protein n=1 Tax=Ficus carica TaxID=3494 RepID=A0AA88JAE8_FICCA|nr:hypothetical protein TIFTF001_035687 [Ficus carica]